MLVAVGFALAAVSTLAAGAALRTTGHWLGVIVAVGSMRFLVIPACAASLDRFSAARRGLAGPQGRGATDSAGPDAPGTGGDPAS